MSTIAHTNTQAAGRAAGAQPKKSREPAAFAAVEAKPIPDRIRARAFEIFEARSSKSEPGDAASDWSQAERELAAAQH